MIFSEMSITGRYEIDDEKLVGYRCTFVFAMPGTNLLPI